VLWAPIHEQGGYLGVGFEDQEGKVIANRVLPNHAGDLGGLRQEDQLLKIGDEQVYNTQQVIRSIRHHPPRSRLPLTVRRGDREITVDVVLEESTDWGGPVTAVYYDCSPGGEDLIGWTVNRGASQPADFFSAGRFRNIFYRPDVVERVLATRDPMAALTAANRALGRPEAKAELVRDLIPQLSPPIVELETGGVFGKVTLPASATTVKVRYRVRQTGLEAPTKVSVRFNGRLVDVAAPLPAAGASAEVEVPVPANMSGSLSVLAEHRLAVSDPAMLRIERGADAHPRAPDLYILSVGVAHLKMNEPEQAKLLQAGDMDLPELGSAGRDASIAYAFAAQKGRVYQSVFPAGLVDKAATAAAVRAALKDIATKAGPEDVAIFFFAGHGVIDSKVGFYLATYDADPKNPSATAITGAELATLLERIKARTVLALDTCHSGGAFSGGRTEKVVTGPQDLTGLINQFSSAEQGTVVFSACGPMEESLEDPSVGGVFTQALREGVGVRQAIFQPGGGFVTCRGLETFLTARVPQLARSVSARYAGGPDAVHQTPTCVIPKGVLDFPLARP